VIALSTYALGTFLGGLVLRAMSTRNLVANITTGTMLAVCGVNVPVEYFPDPVSWFAHLLPVTHGLEAIRDLLAGAGPSEILPNVGLELLVGAGWFGLALLTFNRLAENGRRDGSIEFAP
jgi:ABC-2 type transport system permease protein